MFLPQNSRKQQTCPCLAILAGAGGTVQWSHSALFILLALFLVVHPPEVKNSERQNKKQTVLCRYVLAEQKGMTGTEVMMRSSYANFRCETLKLTFSAWEDMCSSQFMAIGPWTIDNNLLLPQAWTIDCDESMILYKKGPYGPSMLFKYNTPLKTNMTVENLIFNRKYIFKWWMFHCRVTFRGGTGWSFRCWLGARHNDVMTPFHARQSCSSGSKKSCHQGLSPSPCLFLPFSLVRRPGP